MNGWYVHNPIICIVKIDGIKIVQIYENEIKS